jgi:hypothetical protein
MVLTIESKSEEILEQLVKENEQEIVEAWRNGIEDGPTDDIVVFLVRNKDDVNIGTGPRLEFLKETDLIEDFTDILDPAPISDIPHVKNFWTIAVDTESGDNCLWLMSTFLINSYGGTS